MAPKGKNTRNKVSMKQQKKIKSRLMEISLRLDEYVYKNQRISVADAKEYIDEIANYKPQCCDNLRSMQVIEKLTRCMTGIINEQQSLDAENAADTYNCSVHETQTCVSPVYSLPDEDRLYTQAAFVYIDTSNTNIQPHFSVQTVDEEYFNNNNNNKETQTPVRIVDLCRDDDNTFNMTVDVDVHRDMSNLSITNIDGRAVVNESPSILDNIERVTQPNTKIRIEQNATKVMYTPEMTKKQFQSTLQSVNQNKTRSDNNIRKQTVTNVLQNVNRNAQGKKAFLIQNMKKNIHKEQNASNISKSDDGVAIPPVVEVVRSTPPLPQHNNKASIQMPKENIANKSKTNKVCKKENNSNKTNETKTVSCKRKTKKDGDNAQNGTTKIKKTSNDRTCIGVVDNREELKSKNQNIRNNIPSRNTRFKNNTVNTNPKVINRTVSNIYNKKPEDDLSWIENIRYVREVTIDELDPKLTNIEHTFSDSFPNDWNDQEAKVYL